MARDADMSADEMQQASDELSKMTPKEVAKLNRSMMYRSSLLPSEKRLKTGMRGAERANAMLHFLVQQKRAGATSSKVVAKDFITTATEATQHWWGRWRLAKEVGKHKAQAWIDSGRLKDRPDQITGATGEDDLEYFIVLEQGKIAEGKSFMQQLEAAGGSNDDGFAIELPASGSASLADITPQALSASASLPDLPPPALAEEVPPDQVTTDAAPIVKDDGDAQKKNEEAPKPGDKARKRAKSVVSMEEFMQSWAVQWKEDLLHAPENAVASLLSVQSDLKTLCIRAMPIDFTGDLIRCADICEAEMRKHLKDTEKLMVKLRQRKGGDVPQKLMKEVDKLVNDLVHMSRLHKDCMDSALRFGIVGQKKQKTSMPPLHAVKKEPM